ncbi:hypothetical protein EK21DRAFT_119502 [Setomelanomma holmii]|uniref:Uncharacterized protein n=1 Tax=Setomelanomma holmii TaxID=210430 RepID=A0A9P4LDZ3_9PLEO|nr:hypothetical protein EK21DRAFT_119502 [Setomelanomma holmii]
MASYQPPSATSMELFGSYDMLQPSFSPSALDLHNDQGPHPTNDLTRDAPQSADGQMGQIIAVMNEVAAILETKKSSDDEKGQRLEYKIDQQGETLQQVLWAINQVNARIDSTIGDTKRYQLRNEVILKKSVQHLKDRMEERLKHYLDEKLEEKLKEKVNNLKDYLDEKLKDQLKRQHLDDLIKF